MFIGIVKIFSDFIIEKNILGIVILFILLQSCIYWIYNFLWKFSFLAYDFHLNNLNWIIVFFHTITKWFSEFWILCFYNNIWVKILVIYCNFVIIRPFFFFKLFLFLNILIFEWSKRKLITVIIFLFTFIIFYKKTFCLRC